MYQDAGLASPRSLSSDDDIFEARFRESFLPNRVHSEGLTNSKACLAASPQKQRKSGTGSSQLRSNPQSNGQERQYPNTLASSGQSTSFYGLSSSTEWQDLTAAEKVLEAELQNPQRQSTGRGHATPTAVDRVASTTSQLRPALPKPVGSQPKQERLRPTLPAGSSRPTISELTRPGSAAPNTRQLSASANGTISDRSATLSAALTSRRLVPAVSTERAYPTPNQALNTYSATKPEQRLSANNYKLPGVPGDASASQQHDSQVLQGPLLKSPKPRSSQEPASAGSTATIQGPAGASAQPTSQALQGWPQEYNPHIHSISKPLSTRSGESLYHRGIERKAQNAERAAAIKAEAEAALLQGCTFSPRINNGTALHGQSQRSTSQSGVGKTFTAAALSPSRTRPAKPTASSSPATHPTRLPAPGSLTSGISLAFTASPQSGFLATARTNLPASTSQLPRSSAALGPGGVSEPLRAHGTVEAAHQPAQNVLSQTGMSTGAGQAHAGTRLYLAGLETLQHKAEAARQAEEAQAADWRRHRPVARQLDSTVYGAEANARVARLRSRSPSPVPRRPNLGLEECTFHPRTNPRSPREASHSTAASPPLTARSAATSSGVRAGLSRPGSARSPSPAGSMRSMARSAAPSLASALIHNAAAMGLRVEGSGITTAQELDFGEFLARQQSFLQTRDAKVSMQQARAASAPRRPNMSPGSRRILARHPSPDRMTPVHATPPQRGSRAQEQHAFSFRPAILPASSALPARGDVQRSLGDAMRRALNREQQLEQARAFEDSLLTFKPKTLPSKGRDSRVDCMNASATFKQVMEQRKQQHLAQQQALEEKELARCTFTPTTHSIPAYIHRMAASHAATAAPVPTKAKNNNNRFYSTQMQMRHAMGSPCTSPGRARPDHSLLNRGISNTMPVC